MKRHDLTIVIPAYCEERRIGQSLKKLAQFLDTETFLKQKSIEVLVVAADTPDNTHDIIKSKQKLFKHCTLLKPGPHVGKGRDVQYGMLRATGTYVIFMDADLATPLPHIVEFYRACADQNNDIVIGTRDLMSYRHSKFRGVFSSIGNALYRIVGGMPVKDTQCGFKMFSAAACKLCFSKLTILGWGFDLEILAIAQANHLRVKAIDLPDWQHQPFSTYNDGVLRIITRMTRDFTIITINKIYGVYRR